MADAGIDGEAVLPSPLVGPPAGPLPGAPPPPPNRIPAVGVHVPGICGYDDEGGLPGCVDGDGEGYAVAAARGAA